MKYILILITSCLFLTQANANEEFVWNEDFDSKLSAQEANLAKTIVKAHNLNDAKLGFKSIHSSIYSNKSCKENWERRFIAPRKIFSDKYGVKYEKKDGSRILIIKSKIPGKDKYVRIKFSPVIEENGKLVIKPDCLK